MRLKYSTIEFSIDERIDLTQRESISRGRILEGHDINNLSRHHHLMSCIRTFRHIIFLTLHQAIIRTHSVARCPMGIHKQVDHGIASHSPQQIVRLLLHNHHLLWESLAFGCHVKRLVIDSLHALNVIKTCTHQTDGRSHLLAGTDGSQLHMIAHLLLASTLLRDTQHDIIIVEVTCEIEFLLEAVGI